MEKLNWVSYFLLGGCLAVSAWTDARTRTISVKVCLAFAAAGAVLAIAETGWKRSPAPLLSAVLGVLPAVLMFAVSRWTKGALGEGDAILFGVSGIFLGLTGNIVFIWTTCIFTLAAGGICIALGRMTRKSTLPMGPFALAAWAALGVGGFLL